MSLFGNLFDENGDGNDDEDESGNEGTAPACANSSLAGSVKHDEKPGLTEPEKPPAARPEHGLCGILNRGATCYLNSLLQVSNPNPFTVNLNKSLDMQVPTKENNRTMRHRPMQTNMQKQVNKF